MDSVWHATKTPKTMPKFRKHAAARPANLVFHFIQFERAPNKATTTTRRGKQQWQHHLQLRRQSLRLFMSQPHVASSTTTENDNEAAVDTCCHLLPTLVSLCASVICIKQLAATTCGRSTLRVPRPLFLQQQHSMRNNAH